MTEISKLSEYTAYIEELPPSFTISRGQSKDYALLPTALRTEKDSGNRKYHKRSVGNFLDQFKMNSYPYLDSQLAISNDIEWMLYAQHYGLPTKLMDFTTSHITSLLFAVEKAFLMDDEEDAVVYFVDPAALNQKSMQRSSIVNISNAGDINPADIDGPVVVHGRRINPRINAQKGVFVLFEDTDTPLDGIEDEQVIRKVTICGDATKEILSSLFSMGISFSHIYPELSSVSKDILLQQDIDNFLKEQD
jgi:hypothetical protein